MSAGELRARVAFQQRVLASDGHGNQEDEFADEFQEPVRLRPRLGGEAAVAARLEGKYIVNLIVRYSTRTAQVDPSWRARNVRTGEVLNIRSVVNPDERRRYLEMLCEVSRG